MLLEILFQNPGSNSYSSAGTDQGVNLANHATKVISMSTLESPFLYNIGFKKQIYVVPGLWGKKDEPRIVLTHLPVSW